MTHQVDALIIGAGPTGLSLGLGLIKQGKSVLIAEKHLHGLDFSRAILINADTLRALEPFGVSQHLRAAGIAVDGFTMHVNGRPISQARFAVDEHDMTHPICLPQLRTEEILTECFVQAGGQLLKGYEFKSQEANFADNPIRTMLSRYQGVGEPLEVRSAWLFGCDGFHSAVRSALEISYPGTSLTVKPYAVDLTLTHWPFDTNVNVFLERQGGCLAVQIGPNRVRLVTTTQAQRDAFMKSLPVREVTWDSTFDVHFHVAQGYGRDKVWLAGDAVHVHSPVGGRGMNMGIIDAITLADCLQVDDLERYAKSRQSQAHQWVRFNERISTLVLDSSAKCQWGRAAMTQILPLIGKIMGPRLASKAFNRLSASSLELKR